MPQDENRYPVSGTITISGGASSPETVLDLREASTLRIEYIKVDYNGDATSAGQLILYDETDGTPSADLDRDIEGFQLAASADRVVVDDPSLDDVERDIIVEPDGNQDAAVQLTIGGTAVTG